MNTGDSDEPLSEDERIWALLDRYLAGDAQRSDVAAVREWVSADPTRAQIIEDLRRIREVAIASRRHRSAAEAWRELLAKLDAETARVATAMAAGVNRGNPGRGERRVPGFVRRDVERRRVWYAGAAALLLATGLPLVLTSTFAAPPAQPARDAARSFATARGRLAEVRLPDGTRVSLGPESRVTWASSGDSLGRDVLLQGEAYFDVVHDDRRPFRVRARNVEIRDVGTRFAVRAYPTDSLVRVAVTHGEVRMRAATAPQESGATLDPGMLGLVNAAGVTSVRRDADTARYNAFARGQMQFVRTPLRNVIDELERWYDIDIQLSDHTLGNRRITATLDDQTLPDLLKQLSITLNLRVTHTGRLVVLHAE